MRKWACFVLLAVAGALLWGCSQSQEIPSPSPVAQSPAASPTTVAGKPGPPAVARPVVKSETGGAGDTYEHRSLVAGSPGMNIYPALAPGQATKLDRAYPGAPPQIPHSIAGLVATKDSNSCTGCHKIGAELSPGHSATRIPDSHYTNPQTGEKRAEIDGRRYVCLSCHVPQSADQPVLQRSN